jgi:hypothetical protein
MTNLIFRIILTSVAVSLVAASVGIADDANAIAEKPRNVTIKGVVSVIKNDKGAIMAVNLTTEDKVANNVALDKIGMDLAKADGKNVEAQAIKLRTDLIVISFKVIEKATEKPAEKQKTDEYSLAYDSTAKLANILRLSMPAQHTEITSQMKAFLQSNQYEKISDPTKRQLMKETFECARKASSEQSFEAGQAISQGTIKVVTLCSLFCFPECKEFCNEPNVPMEKFFNTFQKLADRGNTLWP